MGGSICRAAGLAAAQLAREDLGQGDGSNAGFGTTVNVGLWLHFALGGLCNQGQHELEWEMHISYAGWPLVQTNNDGSEVRRPLVLHAYRSNCFRMPRNQTIASEKFTEFGLIR